MDLQLVSPFVVHVFLYASAGSFLFSMPFLLAKCGGATTREAAGFALVFFAGVCTVLTWCYFAATAAAVLR